MANFPQAMVVVLSVLTGISDIYSRRVGNAWLAIALLLGTFWVVFVWWQGQRDVPWTALAGLLIGLFAMLPFYVFGWMGAGDVKFFAVLGFLMGAKALLPIWIVASLLGGVHAMALLLSRRVGPWGQALQVQLAGTRIWQRILVARQGRKGLPMAAYMAVGALATVAMPQLAHW